MIHFFLSSIKLSPLFLNTLSETMTHYSISKKDTLIIMKNIRNCIHDEIQNELTTGMNDYMSDHLGIKYKSNKNYGLSKNKQNLFIKTQKNIIELIISTILDDMEITEDEFLEELHLYKENKFPRDWIREYMSPIYSNIDIVMASKLLELNNK